MPLPAVLRRISKAMPSIFQAIAIVAFIHLVGQVRCSAEYGDFDFVCAKIRQAREDFDAKL
jgi:hypothetical protein